jgi:hypothetical protein
MARAKSKIVAAQSLSIIGFKTKFLLTADKLHNNMDAAEHKHVVASELTLTV